MRFFPQTNAADAEKSKVTAVAPTKSASVVLPNLEFRLLLLLFNKRLLCHSYSRRSQSGSSDPLARKRRLDRGLAVIARPKDPANANDTWDWGMGDTFGGEGRQATP